MDYDILGYILGCPYLGETATCAQLESKMFVGYNVGRPWPLRTMLCSAFVAEPSKVLV